jgi:phosphoglycolate phosphatase-like HAD superfamily hydrolase
MPADRAPRPLPTTLAVAAVLFDLDGTLADTAGDLALAVNRIRRVRGLEPVPVEALRAHASAGARGLLGAGMGVTPDHADYPQLRDEFLANYAAGLATNKAMRFTQPVVEALGLDARAGVIVSGDTTAHPKPHPEPLLHAARLLEVEASQCVYVGDDLRDVIAGNAAGMSTIVAEYGYLGNPGNADEWPATGWIADPLALLQWLPETPPA